MQFWGDALVHFQCLYPALLDALFVSRTPAFGCIPSWLFLEPNPGVADAFLENTAADDTTHGIARNAIFRHGRVPATVTAIVPRLYEYVTTRGIPVSKSLVASRQEKWSLSALVGPKSLEKWANGAFKNPLGRFQMPTSYFGTTLEQHPGWIWLDLVNDNVPVTALLNAPDSPWPVYALPTYDMGPSTPAFEPLPL